MGALTPASWTTTRPSTRLRIRLGAGYGETPHGDGATRSSLARLEARGGLLPSHAGSAGDSSVGREGGKVSNLPTVTQLRRTTGRSWIPRDCSGQVMEVGAGNRHVWHCSGQNLFGTSVKTPPKSLQLFRHQNVQGTESPRGLSTTTRQETLSNPLGRQSPGLCQSLLEPQSPQIQNAERYSKRGTILHQKGSLRARTPHKRAQYLWRPRRPPPNRTPSQRVDQPSQMQIDDLLPQVVVPVQQPMGVPECSTSFLMSLRPKPDEAEESQPNLQVVSVRVQREATDVTDQSGSAPKKCKQSPTGSGKLRWSSHTHGCRRWNSC